HEHAPTPGGAKQADGDLGEPRHDAGAPDDDSDGVGAGSALEERVGTAYVRRGHEGNRRQRRKAKRARRHRRSRAIQLPHHSPRRAETAANPTPSSAASRQSRPGPTRCITRSIAQPSGTSSSGNGGGTMCVTGLNTGASFGVAGNSCSTQIITSENAM